MKTRIAILISGNGTNMEAIIKNTQTGILKDYCEVVAVVANRRDAKGLQKAAQLMIPTQCIPSNNKPRETFEHELIEWLTPYHLDYIVLAGFMRVLTPVFINAFKGKIINIHPADGTVYQGPAGYKWAFENKLNETYITVHYVDEGLDTGLMIAKHRVDLEGVSSLEEVKSRGLSVENVVYSEALLKLFKNEKARSSICAVS